MSHDSTNFTFIAEHWHPMPAAADPRAVKFRNMFQHPTDPETHGPAQFIKAWYPVSKQKYRFDIGYAITGDVHTFILPCPSLPYEVSRDLILGMIL